RLTSSIAFCCTLFAAATSSSSPRRLPCSCCNCCTLSCNLWLRECVATTHASATIATAISTYSIHSLNRLFAVAHSLPNNPLISSMGIASRSPRTDAMRHHRFKHHDGGACAKPATHAHNNPCPLQIEMQRLAQ